MPQGDRPMSLADFDVQEVISKGSFGVVYRAVRRRDGAVFALKQVRLKGMKKVERQEALDEARTLAQLRHPHVVRHYGTFIDSEERLNIVMEYAASGSLGGVLKAAKGGGLPEARVWRYLVQSLLGLAYIHSKKIIHRDIKPQNLFLDAADNVKIGDLGIARNLSDGSDFAHTLVGTPYYLSPELCDDRPYNEKSDIWALGVVMYECCMGRHPFEAKNEGALIRKIIKGAFPPVRGPYSQALTHLVEQLMAFDPRRRPEAAQLLRQPVVAAQAHTLGINMNPRLTLEEGPAPAGALAALGAAAPGGLPQPQQLYPADVGAAARGGSVPGKPRDQRQQQQHQQQQVYSLEPVVAAGPHPFELPPELAPDMGPHYHHQQQQHQQPYSPQGAVHQRQVVGEYQQQPGPYQVPYHQQQAAQQPYQHARQPAEQQPWAGAGTPAAAGPGAVHPAGGAYHQHPQHQHQQQQPQWQQGHQQPQQQPQWQQGHQQPQRQQQPPYQAPAAPKHPALSAGAAAAALQQQVAANTSSMYQTTSQMASAAAWTNSAEANTRYGRKRATDLMATAPGMRGPRGLSAGRAVVAAADDTTSYYSSTYATTSVVRR